MFLFGSCPIFLRTLEGPGTLVSHSCSDVDSPRLVQESSLRGAMHMHVSELARKVPVLLGDHVSHVPFEGQRVEVDMGVRRG